MVKEPPVEIQEYLSGLSEEFEETLRHLRDIILATVPDATEQISYKIPCVKCGKLLVGYGATKNYCSFYTMSPRLVARMADRLGSVRVSGATIHFDPGARLPAALIEEIVLERVQEIESTP